MIFRRTLLFAYILFILLIIVLPINSKGSKINNTFFFDLRVDYICHSILFFPWMFLLPTKTIHVHGFKWFCFGLFFAIFTETIQLFLSYRAFNLNDIAANIFGIFASLLLLILMNRIHFFEKINN